MYVSTSSRGDMRADAIKPERRGGSSTIYEVGAHLGVAYLVLSIDEARVLGGKLIDAADQAEAANVAVAAAAEAIAAVAAEQSA